MPIVVTITIPITVATNQDDESEDKNYMGSMRIAFKNYEQFMDCKEVQYQPIQAVIDKFVMYLYGPKAYNDDFVSTHNVIEITNCGTVDYIVE